MMMIMTTICNIEAMKSAFHKHFDGHAIVSAAFVMKDEIDADKHDKNASFIFLLLFQLKPILVTCMLVALANH